MIPNKIGFNKYAQSAWTAYKSSKISTTERDNWAVVRLLIDQISIRST